MGDGHCPTCGWSTDQQIDALWLPITPAQRRVIEAAKAWQQSCSSTSEGDRAELDLWDAVEALERSEGEAPPREEERK